MKKIHEVRWLSRSDAVHAVASSYEVLLKFFAEEVDDPAANGIHSQLKQVR